MELDNKEAAIDAVMMLPKAYTAGCEKRKASEAASHSEEERIHEERARQYADRAVND